MKAEEILPHLPPRGVVFMRHDVEPALKRAGLVGNVRSALACLVRRGLLGLAGVEPPGKGTPGGRPAQRFRRR